MKRTPWWRDPGTLLVLALFVAGLVIIGGVNRVR